MCIRNVPHYENTRLHIKCTEPKSALEAHCSWIRFENTSGVVTKTDFLGYKYGSSCTRNCQSLVFIYVILQSRTTIGVDI